MKLIEHETMCEIEKQKGQLDGDLQNIKNIAEANRIELLIEAGLQAEYITVIEKSKNMGAWMKSQNIKNILFGAIDSQ